MKYKFHRRQTRESLKIFNLAQKELGLVGIYAQLLKIWLKNYRKSKIRSKSKWDYLLDSFSNSLRRSKRYGKDILKY
jgi:hypothetical protein